MICKYFRTLSPLVASILVASGASAQDAGGADVIIRGGEVVTVNELQPRAEAVDVKGGKLIAVGYDDQVMKL